VIVSDHLLTDHVVGRACCVMLPEIWLRKKNAVLFPNSAGCRNSKTVLLCGDVCAVLTPNLVEVVR